MKHGKRNTKLVVAKTNRKLQNVGVDAFCDILPGYGVGPFL